MLSSAADGRQPPPPRAKPDESGIHADDRDEAEAIIGIVRTIPI
jgi:hypothetical protein